MLLGIPPILVLAGIVNKLMYKCGCWKNPITPDVVSLDSVR